MSASYTPAGRGDPLVHAGGKLLFAQRGARAVGKALLGERPLCRRLDAAQRARERRLRLLFAAAGRGDGHEVVDEGVFDGVLDRLVGIAV